jgi:excisionase family DNA binding protein
VTSTALTIALPDEVIEAIADRVAERVARSQPAVDEGFLDVTAAAAFLSCRPSRLYALASARRIPHYKDGSRLLFDRRELREYVRNGGARRP